MGDPTLTDEELAKQREACAEFTNLKNNRKDTSLHYALSRNMKDSSRNDHLLPAILIEEGYADRTSRLTFKTSEIMMTIDDSKFKLKIFILN